MLPMRRLIHHSICGSRLHSRVRPQHNIRSHCPSRYPIAMTLNPAKCDTRRLFCTGPFFPSDAELDLDCPEGPSFEQPKELYVQGSETTEIQAAVAEVVSTAVQQLEKRLEELFQSASSETDVDPNTKANLDKFFKRYLPFTTDRFRLPRAAPSLMDPLFMDESFLESRRQHCRFKRSLAPNIEFAAFFAEPGAGKTHVALSIAKDSPAIIYLMPPSDRRVDLMDTDWHDESLAAMLTELAVLIPASTEDQTNRLDRNYLFPLLLCQTEHLARVTIMNAFFATEERRKTPFDQICDKWRRYQVSDDGCSAIAFECQVLRKHFLAEATAAASFGDFCDQTREALAAAHRKHNPVLIFDELPRQSRDSTFSLPRKDQVQYSLLPLAGDSEDPGYADIAHYLQDYSIPTGSPDRPVRVCVSGYLPFSKQLMQPSMPTKYTTEVDVLQLFSEYLTPAAFDAVKDRAHLLAGPLRLSASFLAYLFDQISVLSSSVALVGETTARLLDVYFSQLVDTSAERLNSCAPPIQPYLKRLWYSHWPGPLRRGTTTCASNSSWRHAVRLGSVGDSNPDLVKKRLHEQGFHFFSGQHVHWSPDAIASEYRLTNHVSPLYATAFVRLPSNLAFLSIHKNQEPPSKPYSRESLEEYWADYMLRAFREYSFSDWLKILQKNANCRSLPSTQIDTFASLIDRAEPAWNRTYIAKTQDQSACTILSFRPPSALVPILSDSRPSSAKRSNAPAFYFRAHWSTAFPQLL
eukprot:TRINITY_DN556_c0_g1_i1.p1 TRINITY_DN556_c0_g1~~TRINITY_DN556_c0_g1_i1.p1  ORF type:complete len:750 (+),score=55.34 TRINITY_DN556_c0_g1_i1:437-2686(+)